MSCNSEAAIFTDVYSYLKTYYRTYNALPHHVMILCHTQCKMRWMPLSVWYTPFWVTIKPNLEILSAHSQGNIKCWFSPVAVTEDVLTHQVFPVLSESTWKQHDAGIFMAATPLIDPGLRMTRWESLLWHLQLIDKLLNFSVLQCPHI